MELLARARELEAQGRSLVHMEIGEPDFATASPIIQAAQNALTQKHCGYTPAAGLPELRSAIAAWYRQRYGVEVAAERIFVTPGASGALLMVLAAVLSPGDQVLVTDPGYPCYRHLVRLLEGQACAIAVAAPTRYQLTVALLAKHWSSRCVAALVGSPSNPTGTLLAAEELQALAAQIKRRSGVLIVDEIYHGLTYGATAPQTALAYSDDVFVINSFSKYFGMTGWRVGWVVAPVQYVDALHKLAQNIFLAASSIGQYGALAALTAPALAIFEERRKQFGERRDFLVPALREMGFDIAVEPQGAFYVYANCARFTDDSFAFAHRLLQDVGVVATPGIDFGEHEAAQHLRFAYTTSMENLVEGLARLRRYVGA
jgi:aspartate/methionine/tyrosine aminotransferase